MLRHPNMGEGESSMMQRTFWIACACLVTVVACGEVVPTNPSDAASQDDARAAIDAPAAGPVCGDSKTEGDEVCDSGGKDTVDCNRDCTYPRCGDGRLNLATEMCDDGNPTDDGNGCDVQCRKNSVCGDATVQDQFEACDGSPGCSLDCKIASTVTLPVSDRGGLDMRANGTWDGLNGEDSTGEAVTWSPLTAQSDAQERRIAFEFDTRALRASYLIADAHFAIFPSNITSVARTLQLRGYLGNGAVEVTDLTAETLVTSFLAANTAPVSLDIKAFLQTAAREQYPFTGLLLRLDMTQAADDFFNLGMAMSNNANPDVRPRLSLSYCVDLNHDNECD